MLIYLHTQHCPEEIDELYHILKTPREKDFRACFW